ncbi:uncharacterized protein LOC121979479 [Zingiber officinale]|uniref:uncharacterized protein LOC121979479 n=1 Tax=Zingiber officinale TaxID=94328 RepID=UPI001C4C1C51|nr:uncharacterized protein LOC121979479 [Zingiber officinale]
MWIIIKTDISIPLNGTGKPISCENWDASIIKKVEANAKATCTLQCGLTKEELNRVGPFSSTKKLCEKLIELHKGTSDTKTSYLLELSAQKEEASLQQIATLTELLAQKEGILQEMTASRDL